MRTESSLVASILQRRPVVPTEPQKFNTPTVAEQTCQQLLSEVQIATKIINEIFIEASMHVQEFSRLKSNTVTSMQEEEEFTETFRSWFNGEIRSAINQMPGAAQSVACYVLKDRLERFPIFNPQWTPPFVRNGTVLEKFLRSQSPTLLSNLSEVENLLTRHKTNASLDEKDTVEQWQAALNELAHTVAPRKALKL